MQVDKGQRFLWLALYRCHWHADLNVYCWLHKLLIWCLICQKIKSLRIVTHKCCNNLKLVISSKFITDAVVCSHSNAVALATTCDSIPVGTLWNIHFQATINKNIWSELYCRWVVITPIDISKMSLMVILIYPEASFEWFDGIAHIPTTRRFFPRVPSLLITTPCLRRFKPVANDKPNCCRIDYSPGKVTEYQKTCISGKMRIGNLFCMDWRRPRSLSEHCYTPHALVGYDTAVELPTWLRLVATKCMF